MSLDVSDIDDDLDLPAGFEEALEARNSESERSYGAADQDDEFEDDFDDQDDDQPSDSRETNAGKNEPPAEDAWMTPEILELADGFGFSADEVKEFGSFKALNAAVRGLKRQAATLQPAEKATAEKQDAPPKEFNWKEEFKPEELEDVDPLLAKVFDRFASELKAKDKRIAEFEGQLAPINQIQQHLQVERERNLSQWMDTQFVRPEYEALFGKGNVAEIQADKANKGKFDNRLKVWNSFQRLLQDKANEKVPPVELFEKAVALEFHKELRGLGTKTRDEAIRQQASRRIGKPGKPLAPNGKRNRKPQPLTKNRELMSEIETILSRSRN